MKRTWVSIKIIKCFRLKVDSRGSLHRRSMSTPDDSHNQHTKVSHQIIVWSCLCVWCWAAAIMAWL